jgi:hypothetical protein
VSSLKPFGLPKDYSFFAVLIRLMVANVTNGWAVQEVSVQQLSGIYAERGSVFDNAASTLGRDFILRRRRGGGKDEKEKAREGCCWIDVPTQLGTKSLYIIASLWACSHFFLLQM